MAGESPLPQRLTLDKITISSSFLFRRRRAEQEAIAEALSDADVLIESLEQLIAKKRQMKQGAMQDLAHWQETSSWL